MGVIKSVFKWVNAESSRSGKSKSTVFVSFVKDYLKYGVNPKEYYWFHFDGKTDAQKKTFFTRQMFRKLLKRNNDPAFVQILNDKYIFSQTFSDYTGRKCIRTGKHMISEELADLLEDTERIIYKSKDGSGGVGMKVIDKSDYPGIEVIANELRSLPDGVVEQWIKQHPSMSELYPDAVNCIRVATLYRDGKCHFLGAVFTIGYNREKIANALKGALFGLIDIKTGKVISDLCNYSDQLFTKHPDTGFVARGFKVPYWKEVLDLTAKAAAIVPEVGYVGWDVAISENGPVLIEGNSLSAGYFAYEHYLLREDGIGSREVWEPFVK